MSTQSAEATSELTDYEAEQVRLIAAWKAERPPKFSEMFNKLTMPVTRVIEKAIPVRLFSEAIDKACATSEHANGQAAIRRRAGVKDLDELRRWPLEDCDRLAHEVGIGSQGLAAVEGVLSGSGGVLTSAMDLPLMFVLALRAIHKAGYCYGYALNRPADRRYVLGIFMIAATNSPEKKQELLAHLREVEEWLLEQTEEGVVEEEAVELLLQIEVFDDLPGLGAVAGGLLNYALIRRVENAARRVFQERRLRDDGKVVAIEPAASARLVKISGRRAAGWSRAIYGGCYYLGFGLALPTCLVASAIGAHDNAMIRGVRDGAKAARRRVGRLRGVPATD